MELCSDIHMCLLFSIVVLLLCQCSGEAQEIPESFQPTTPVPQPVFILNPADVFVVKNKPAELFCKAQPATRVLFKCNNKFYQADQHQQLQNFDEFVQEKYIYVKISISKQDVESYSGEGGYYCTCVAWNDNTEPVESERAYVRIASLDRHFIHEPESQNMPRDSEILLKCGPPPGDPEPETYWIKDGIPLVNDIHIFMTTSKDLIINRAMLEDSGNYTCIVENIAGRRKSNTARVNVFVAGIWASWSTWGSCDPLCGPGFQRRSRTCSNPTPLNGGPHCRGKSYEKQECSNICPINGHYSQWTDWALCNAQCKQLRTRECNNPPPSNNGRSCEGSPPLDRRNCTGGNCQVGLYYGREGAGGLPVGVHGPTIAEQIPVYIGIALAFFVVLMACIFIAICLMSRRKREIPSYPQTTTVDECSMAMLTMQQPDITQTGHLAFCTHVALPNECEKVPNGIHRSNSYSDNPKTSSLGHPHNMTVSFSPKNGAITHLGGYNSSSHSEGSHYSLPNGSSKGSQVHTYVPLVGPGQERHYCTANKEHPCCHDPCYGPEVEDSDFYSAQKDEPVYALPVQSSEESVGHDSELDGEHLSTVDMGPGHLKKPDTNMMAAGRFGPRGGRLIIPEAGVSLFIPEGAITRNAGEEIYIAVNPDPTIQPNISPQCTSLSPVVTCGPPSLALSKPIILTLPHCSQRRDGDWRYSIYYCNTAAQIENIWERLVTVGEETINTPVYCQVDSNNCSIVTDHLGSFVLLGESTPHRTAGKRLRLAAFGPTLRFNMDYNVKVYVTDDNPDAIERIVQLEQKFGGTLLHRPKLMEFQDDGGNLILTLEDVVHGWKCKLASNFQEIPFFHVWSGNTNTLHCSFTLAREDPSLDMVGCRLKITQGSAQGSLQILDVSRRMDDGMEYQHYHASQSHSSAASFETPTKVFRLPRPVRARLCACLDPPRNPGNDWRMLSAKLGVDGYINFFATKPSPTDQILDLWEARCREDSALMMLVHLLREMGRTDAVAIIEQGPWM